jgi:phytoene dehydrogenase-like protein
VSSTTNHYDLIVLGNDVAGLVSAALVARRGKRVLVLPHGTPDGAVRLQGRVLALDCAPVVHAATPPVERVLHELGLQQQLRRMHAPVSGLVQHVLGDARLDLEPGERNLERELDRAWPSEPALEAWTLRHRWAAATDEVLDELLASDGALSADGFWGRRFLSRVASQLPARDTDELAPLPAEHGLRAIAEAPLPWLQHLTPAQLGKAASLRLGRLWSLGPDDLPAGERRVREILLQRIELHSGEIKRELRVAEILVKRGKVVGVSLLGKRDRYGCDHLIVATDPRLLLDKTMLADAAPRSLVTSLAAIAPAAYRYVMHLEVDERGVTPALSGLALVTPARRGSDAGVDASDADFVPDRAHGVGHTYLRAEPGPTEGLRRIAITRIVGVEEPLGELRESILAELDERGVLPFVHDYVRLCHSPHDGREATDARGDAVDELGPGTAMSVPMSPLYFVEGEPLLGVGLLPTTSGVRGLSFASRLNLPGLGLEGEFAAGTAAAGLVASPAKSPLSRSSLLSKA